MKPDTDITPMFIDITADATHQGKSLFATRLRDHCEDAGIPVALVRIESQRLVDREALRPGDVLVATEMIAQSDKMPGGIVGVMRPGFSKLEEMAALGGVTIWDWGGSLGSHRLEVLAATALDKTLARRSIHGVAVVVTTNVAACMAQARLILERTEQCAPGLRRVLVLNELGGAFAFPAGTEPEKLANGLTGHAGLTATVRLRRVAGESLAALQPLRLGVRDLIQTDTETVCRILGMDEFTATACLTHVAAWYEQSRAEVARILPFQDAGPRDGREPATVAKRGGKTA